MDLTKTIEPKSDQLNADDLISGERTFTIEKVTGGSTEQPVNIHLVENPGKPYRPSKSMRRVLVAAWGKDSEAYVGQRLTLYRDPSIKFGGIAVGGIVISHMTGIDKPLKISLTVTRAKRALTTIQPLKGEPAPTAAPGMVSEQTWREIAELAASQSIESPGAWASEQLGRKLQGWAEITESEGDQLLKVLTTGETS